MPAGDRTGPDGMGPMTGRRAGYCAGSDRPGYTHPGRGLGRGRRRGRRFVADNRPLALRREVA